MYHFQEKVVPHWVCGTDFFLVVTYSQKRIVKETSPPIRDLKFSIRVDLVSFIQISS